jgi:ribosome modulation factor
MPENIKEMTANTIGSDLLNALVQELRLLPKPWPSLSKKVQDEIIDRLRARTKTAIATAVHILSAQGRITLTGELAQITIKNGVKAVVEFPSSAESLHELFDAAGKPVLIVVSGILDHTIGMDSIKGEADQRSMDLGHEYHDNDGGGMDDDSVIDAPALPAPEDVGPTKEELDNAYSDGFDAGQKGCPSRDVPNTDAALVKAWLSGWNRGRDLQSGDPCADDDPKEIE